MLTTRRIARSATALAVVSLVSATIYGAPLAFGAGEARPTHAALEGTVVRLADAPGAPHVDGEDEGTTGATVLQLPDRTFVPVDGAAVQRVSSGQKVRVTVVVPPAVAAAARAGDAAPVKGGTITLDRGDLASAERDGAAAPTSDLSRATAAAASASGAGLATSGVTVLGAAPAALYRPAVHDLYVAVVTPRGVSGTPATAAQVRAQVAAASAYWSEQSGGGVSFRVRVVTAPYRSAFRCTDDVFKPWSEAADRIGFTEAPNRHLVLSYPRGADTQGCSYGLASIGAGPNAGGIALVSDTAWPVLAHELGHNLGLEHAKALVCTRADVALNGLPRGCSVTEYGYPWDVMAASAPDRAGSLSAPQAIRLGFLRAGQFASVASGSRTLTLAPRAAATGVRAVEVADPVSKARYYVEYRARVGRDKVLYKNVPAGVRIVRLDAGGRGSMVLDATPTGRTDDVRQIAPGAAFTSYAGGVRVEVRSAGATATVVVSSGTAAVRAAAKAAALARARAAAAIKAKAAKARAAAIKAKAAKARAAAIRAKAARVAKARAAARATSRGISVRASVPTSSRANVTWRGAARHDIR